MAQGDVYKSSGAQFAYNTQSQADTLFIGWLDKSKAVGDWQSALAFVAAWDNSTGQGLAGSDENYRGYASAGALAYRQSIGQWINSQSTVIQQTIAATQIVTGGLDTVTAQAAQGSGVAIAALEAAGLPVPPLVPGQSTPPVSGPLPPAPSSPAGSSPATSGLPNSGIVALTNATPSTTLPVEGNAGITDIERNFTANGFAFLPSIPKAVVLGLGALILIALFWGDN